MLQWFTVNTFFDNISGYIKEYNMKINMNKSKIVCIKKESWNFGGCEIDKVEEYKYLGITVKTGLNDDF